MKTIKNYKNHRHFVCDFFHIEQLKQRRKGGYRKIEYFLTKKMENTY